MSEFLGTTLMAVAFWMIMGGAFVGSTLVILAAAVPLGLAALLPD